MAESVVYVGKGNVSDTTVITICRFRPGIGQMNRRCGILSLSSRNAYFTANMRAVQHFFSSANNRAMAAVMDACHSSF